MPATRKLTTSIVNALSKIPIEVVEEPERTIDFFCRIGWVVTDRPQDRAPDSPVILTRLGRAVLRDAEVRDAGEEEELTIVLDPEDPFAYARVIGRIADLGPGLLVDPFFGLEQLGPIAFRTSITRVITGTAKKIDIAGLSTALETTAFDRDFEIRVVDQSEIHDRYIISDSGRTHFIGTSLSGVGNKPSAMGEIHGQAAVAIRELHEELWDAANELITTE